MSEKIQAQHLERKVVLYIRQSSAHQVSHNTESRRLQYGLEQRLRSLGWQEIEIVDEDLGRSAAALDKDTPESRPIEPPEAGPVIAIPQVGGLHHRYTRIAA